MQSQQKCVFHDVTTYCSINPNHHEINKHYFFVFLPLAQCRGEEEAKEPDETTGEPESEPKVEEDIGKSRDGSKTDDETVQREEEAIKLDGLNVAQMKELRDKAEKHAFQAEVSRMMKLIINSLYRNKEVTKLYNYFNAIIVHY